MPSVNWGSSSLAFAGAQRVYVRQNWANAWSLQTNIWCSNASWSLLPTMPVAELELDYGKVLPHGSLVWTTQSKLNLGGWYVKVEFDCADGTLVWYGFIDEAVDEQGGISDSIASGRQRWVAYAMPQALSFEYMTRSRWYDEPNTESRWSGSAITFNANGKPNRSGTAPPSDAGKEQTHLFAPVAPQNIENTTPWEVAKYWSTAEIVHYLQEHAMPLDQTGAEKIQFRIDGQNLLPNWDKPTVETEGKSVLSILEELINPSRLLQMSTRVDEATTPNTVVLQVHSLSSVNISLPDSNSHLANTDVLVIAAASAQDTRVTIQSSESRSAHQVVVKGAKRESVGTFLVSPDGTTDEGLIEGWLTAKQTEYNTGASGQGSYAAKSDEEKRIANQIVRNREELRDVFRSFVINPEWDFAFGGDFLFTDDDDAQYFPWFGGITIAPDLPFKQGLVYDSIPVADDDAKPEYQPPLVVMERPGSSPAEYFVGEKMANTDGDPAFSVEVGLTKDNQGVTLETVGANQHAIAETRFSAQSVDNDDSGEWDYFDSQFTLSWTDDRYCEYEYPQEGSLPARDVIRQKLIYAGEAYRKTKVLAGTVVDIDTDGSLTLSIGGGEQHDDTDKLQSIGQIAASWYLVPRNILRLTSARPSAVPAVGQLVTTINPSTPHAAVVNSVVSEIRLAASRAERSAPANYSLVTSAGELDPLAFAPPLQSTQGQVS